jgi:anti-sigma-K factor RskA
MTTRDHTSYQQEIGAYLLGALTDLERQAFEQHLESCAECREEVERLRPAAEALPRSVEQVEPPRGLKASIMEVVEREAREQSGKPARRSLRERFAGKPMVLRPAFAVGAIALGLAAGFGVAQIGGDDDRTVVATVDETRIPDASGTLRVEGDGEDGAILRVRGMPRLRPAETYQAWVQRGESFVPQPTFDVGRDGEGAVAVPDDLSDAKAVLVTREPRPGSDSPSEPPIINVPL